MEPKCQMCNTAVSELAAKVQATHDAVIILTTRFNGGPGQWPACVQSAAIQQDHEKRLRGLENTILKAVGGAGVVAALFTLAVQWLMKVL